MPSLVSGFADYECEPYNNRDFFLSVTTEDSTAVALKNRQVTVLLV